MCTSPPATGDDNEKQAPRHPPGSWGLSDLRCRSLRRCGCCRPEVLPSMMTFGAGRANEPFGSTGIERSQASGQEVLFCRVRGELEGALVGSPRLLSTLEAHEEVGP